MRKEWYNPTQTMKVTIFWDMTLCSLVCCIFAEVSEECAASILRVKTGGTGYSETSVNV
jgi:hypothetical protein